MSKKEKTRELSLVDDQDGDKEPTMADLQREMTRMQEFIRKAFGGDGNIPAMRKENQETTTEKVLRELSEGYSPEQIATAENWVRRQMGGRADISVGPDGKDEIIFDVHVVTPEDRESGLYNLPDGFQITRSVPVWALARFYLPIILDEDSYQSDAEKLFAVIVNARMRGPKGKKRGTLHPELEYLFDGDGILKGLRRSRKEKIK